MSFSRYYSELLRQGEDTVPTLAEAQQDFQRAVALSNVALGFLGY